MLKRIVNICAVPLFAILAAGVVHAKDLPTVPILAPILIQVPAGASAEDVKKAVRKAMFLKDWLIRDIGPGHLQGQFIKGEKYTIVVDVKHDAKSVGIGYKESTGLNYGSNGTIHKTYNERVKDLEKAMRAELGAF